MLSIESTLVAKGRGTVVTGKVEQGKVSINDELEVVGFDIKATTCLGLECLENLWIMLRLVICWYFNSWY